MDMFAAKRPSVHPVACLPAPGPLQLAHSAYRPWPGQGRRDPLPRLRGGCPGGAHPLPAASPELSWSETTRSPPMSMPVPVSYIATAVPQYHLHARLQRHPATERAGARALQLCPETGHRRIGRLQPSS